jgi:hypothetical protein
VEGIWLSSLRSISTIPRGNGDVSIVGRISRFIHRLQKHCHGNRHAPLSNYPLTKFQPQAQLSFPPGRRCRQRYGTKHLSQTQAVQPWMLVKKVETMHSLKQDNGRPTLTTCTCGKVHFTYGMITFHFEVHEFTFFAGAVARLFAQYQQIYGAEASHSTSSVHNGSCH